MTSLLAGGADADALMDVEGAGGNVNVGGGAAAGAGRGGGVDEAAGFPGSGLTCTTPVSGLDGSFVFSGNGAGPPDGGLWLCGQ